ncbi:hypothetical protein Tco_1096209 [Tanacetum coccineum]
MAQNTIANLKLGDNNIIREGKVYRRWISQSPPNLVATRYLCILLYKEGNAVKANMDANDIEYFEAKSDDKQKDEAHEKIIVEDTQKQEEKDENAPAETKENPENDDAPTKENFFATYSFFVFIVAILKVDMPFKYRTENAKPHEIALSFSTVINMIILRSGF